MHRNRDFTSDGRDAQKQRFYFRWERCTETERFYFRQINLFRFQTSRWTHKWHGMSAAMHTVMSMTRCENWHCLQDGKLTKTNSANFWGCEGVEQCQQFLHHLPPLLPVHQYHLHLTGTQCCKQTTVSVSSYHPHQYHFYLFIFCKMFGFTFAKYLGSLKTSDRNGNTPNTVTGK